jgi:hypothetical protein
MRFTIAAQQPLDRAELVIEGLKLGDGGIPFIILLEDECN